MPPRASAVGGQAVSQLSAQKLEEQGKLEAALESWVGLKRFSDAARVAPNAAPATAPTAAVTLLASVTRAAKSVTSILVTLQRPSCTEDVQESGGDSESETDQEEPRPSPKPEIQVVPDPESDHRGYDEGHPNLGDLAGPFPRRRLLVRRHVKRNTSTATPRAQALASN